MNGNNGTPARQQARRVGNAGRVLPALPLTMTRPKQVRALPSKSAQPDRSPVASKEHVNGVTRHNQTANDATNGHVDAQELEAGIRDEGVYVETPKAKAAVDVKAPLSSIASLEHDVARNGSTVQAPTAHTRDTQNKSAISPVSTRKLAERLDTRGVKTELPPAFVPHQLTPLNPLSTLADQRSADAASQQQQRPRALPTFERDPSPSSWTPQSAEVPAFAPPGFPFMPPHHHHSHHFSEPHVSWQNSAPSHSPMHWAPRGGPNNASQLNFLPNGFGNHHRRPSRDARCLNSNGVPTLPAQRARAETQVHQVDLQSPIHLDHNANRSRMAHSEGRLAFEAAGGRASLMPPMPVMPFSPHGGPPDSPYATDPLSSDALRAHILRVFDSPPDGGLFADCTLAITQGSEVARVPAHRLILARSPTLFAQITNEKIPNAQSELPLDLSSHTRYLTIGLLQEGLRYLYGGPLPSPSFFHIPPPDRMAKALRYVALGSYLAVDAIAHRAMQAVLSLLHWQTVAAALAFALEGGLSSNSWDDGVENPVTSASDSSSEDLPPFRPEHAAATTTSPTYDPFATDLLQHIVNFAVHAIPLDFYIDPAAPEFAEAPRLPTSFPFPSDDEKKSSPPSLSPSPISSYPPLSSAAQQQLPASASSAPTAQSRHQHHTRAKSSSAAAAAIVNPRLSQIRFGEILPPSPSLTAEDHQPPPPPQQQQQQQHRSNESIITSLLLSLPFPVLKYLLEHPALGHRLGPETVASVSRQVVAVREARREKALLRFSPSHSADLQAESDPSTASATQGKSQQPPSVAPAVLYWRESVEPSTASAMGCRVVRWRVGREVLHTPPSELAES